MSHFSHMEYLCALYRAMVNFVVLAAPPSEQPLDYIFTC